MDSSRKKQTFTEPREIAKKKTIVSHTLAHPTKFYQCKEFDPYNLYVVRALYWFVSTLIPIPEPGKQWET